VNYGDETLSVIDAAKGKVLATLHLGKHPQAVAVDTQHNRVYVANVHSDSVTVIDGVTNAVIGSYDAGRNPYALAVDPAMSRIYAANYGDPSFTAIDISGHEAQK
jgi:YVTN family beta-propeller protein